MQHAKTLFISDLLGCRLHTSEGKFLGHVADIQLTEGSEHRVVALIYGRSGLLYRLHVLNPFRRARQKETPPDKVQWEGVDRIEASVITLKPGYGRGNGG